MSSDPTETSITTHRGDCLEVMRKMESESIDLVFTSPPYNLKNSTGGGFKSVGGVWPNAKLKQGYDGYDDARPYNEYVEWQKANLTECWRLIRPDGAIYYNHSPRPQNRTLQTPLDLNPGLTVRQIVIWNRGSGQNFSRCFYQRTHEWIVIFAKDDFRLSENAKAFKDVWTISPARDNDHPAPFPIELPVRALQSTNSKIVLDPFMGSGTTAIACLRENRSFIGIEQSKVYLDKARLRIRDEATRLNLICSQPETVKKAA